MKLTKVIAIFLICANGLSVLGLENTPLFSCELHHNKDTVELKLDAVGKAYLKMSDKDFCDAELSFLGGGRRRHIPGYELAFDVHECRGKMEPLKAAITERISMDINFHTKVPSGFVTWLKTQESEACVLRAFKEDQLILNIDKWKKGTWGPKL
jgi:hypothetical protein